MRRISARGLVVVLAVLAGYVVTIFGLSLSGTDRGDYRIWDVDFPLVQSSNQSGAASAGQKQFETGQFSAAATTLKNATAANPKDAAAHYWLGRTYYEQKNFQGAADELEKATEAEPKNSEYHHWLGRAYGELADKQHSFSLARKVKHEFETAVQLDGNNLEARRDLQQFNEQAPWVVGGSKDVAKQQVEAIAAINPAEGHLARADYDIEVLKKNDLAGKEFEAAVDGNLTDVDGYFEAADFFAKTNNGPELQKAIQGAQKIKPNDPRVAYYQATLQIVNGNFTGNAESQLKAYLASGAERSDWPSHASARDWLGKLYEKQGKRQEASEQYREALQLDPKDKFAREREQQLGSGAQ
jgi:cytochrome c-type biogenesis protein CcmH/NrfG